MPFLVELPPLLAPLDTFLAARGVGVRVLRFGATRVGLGPDHGLLIASLTPAENARLERLPEGARREEWLAARRAERELRVALSAASQPGESPWISISHTCGHVLAVGGVSPGLRGLGVDLEATSREVTLCVRDRITEESERLFPLTPMEWWVAKEAAFKANPTNAGTWMGQYRIEAYDPESGQGLVQAPGQSELLRFAVFHREGWSYASAVAL